MINLKEAKEGRFYRVKWLIGERSNFLRERCGLTEDVVIYILRVRKGGWVIFTLNGRSYGIGPELAYAIKADPV